MSAAFENTSISVYLSILLVLRFHYLWCHSIYYELKNNKYK